jgi:hypothetical protein
VTPEQHRYVYVQSSIGAAIVNAAFNAAAGWVATLGLTGLPTWGMPGVWADFMAMSWGVAAGTCFGTTFQVRSDLKRSKISVPMALSPSLESRLARLPKQLLVRCLLVGILGALLFGLPSLALLGASGVTVFGRGTYMAVKAAFSALEAGVIAPYLVLAALLDKRAPAGDVLA